MAVNILQMHRIHSGAEVRFAWDARWSDVVVAIHRKSTGSFPSEPSKAVTPAHINSMGSEHIELSSNAAEVVDLFEATRGRLGGLRNKPSIDQDVRPSEDAQGRVISFHSHQAGVFEKEREDGIDGMDDGLMPDLRWTRAQFARYGHHTNQVSPRGLFGRLHGRRQPAPSWVIELNQSEMERGSALTPILFGFTKQSSMTRGYA